MNLCEALDMQTVMRNCESREAWDEAIAEFRIRLGSRFAGIWMRHIIATGIAKDKSEEYQRTGMHQPLGDSYYSGWGYTTHREDEPGTPLSESEVRRKMSAANAAVREEQ